MQHGAMLPVLQEEMRTSWPCFRIDAKIDRMRTTLYARCHCSPRSPVAGLTHCSQTHLAFVGECTIA